MEQDMSVKKLEEESFFYFVSVIKYYTKRDLPMLKLLTASSL